MYTALTMPVNERSRLNNPIVLPSPWLSAANKTAVDPPDPVDQGGVAGYVHSSSIQMQALHRGWCSSHYRHNSVSFVSQSYG